jgi:hypothetical protein
MSISERNVSVDPRGPSVTSFSLVDYDTVDEALEQMRANERMLRQHARESSAQRRQQGGSSSQNTFARFSAQQQQRTRSPSNSRGWSLAASSADGHMVLRPCADEIESLSAALAESNLRLRQEQAQRQETQRELRRLRRASRAFCTAELSRANLCQQWAETFIETHALSTDDRKTLEEIVKNDHSGSAAFRYPLWNDPASFANRLLSEEEVALLNLVLLQRDVFARKESCAADHVGTATDSEDDGRGAEEASIRVVVADGGRRPKSPAIPRDGAKKGVVVCSESI